jgi:hypothetical protein
MKRVQLMEPVKFTVNCVKPALQDQFKTEVSSTKPGYFADIASY